MAVILYCLCPAALKAETDVNTCVKEMATIITLPGTTQVIRLLLLVLKGRIESMVKEFNKNCNENG